MLSNPHTAVQSGFIDATNFKMEILTFACINFYFLTLQSFLGMKCRFFHHKKIKFGTSGIFKSSSMSSIFMKIIENKLLHGGLKITNKQPFDIHTRCSRFFYNIF